MSYFKQIFLISGVMLLVGYSSPVEAESTTTVATSTTTTIATSTVATATTTKITAATSTPIQIQLQDRAFVEKKVRAVFADAPVMIEVARCESNFRQFTDSGALFRGGAGGAMVGVFQFYEKAHAPYAHTLGFDLATLEGNVGYARNVYDHQGTTPWKACVPTTPALSDAQMKLKIELLTKLVSLLQELLKIKLATQ